MKPLIRSLIVAPLLFAWRPSPAVAGMPMVTLSDIARFRVQTISFFLLGFLVCALGFQWIWNSLRGDFPRLPRLSPGRAAGVVALWGLFFVLILTMISGARELMTPGAWRKEGYTFKLRESPKSEPEPVPVPVPVPVRDRESDRRRGLDRLRVALWTYARGHERRFPAEAGGPEIPEELWRLPDPSGMRYIYRGGQTADEGAAPLAFEPDLFGDGRLVFLSSGAVRWMTEQETRGNFGTGDP